MTHFIIETGLVLLLVTHAYCACSEPVAPDHGSVDRDGLDEGDTATYSCSTGYQVDQSGSDVVLETTRTCESGAWGDAVTCVAIQCPDPEDVPFSERTPSAEFYYQDTVTYTCDAGYQISEGNETLECGDSGSWVGTWPSCTKKDCGDPGEIDQASRVLTGTEYEHNVTYECYDGYEPEQPVRRTCQEDGTWSGSEPECIGVSCDVPSDEPDHASSDPPSPTYRYPETIEYTCDTGYKADTSNGGITTTKCQENGQWSFDLIACQPVPCTETNGSVNANEDAGTFYYTQIKNYTCKEGFTLDSGDLSRTCLANGSFSGSVPICKGVTCSVLTTPDNSERSGATTHKYLDVVTFECDAGFQVADEVNTYKRVMVCNANGNWSRELPTCEPLSCATPNYGTHAELVSGTQHGYGDTVVVQCEGGYEYSSGDTSRTCQGDRTWSGDPLVCTAINCGQPNPGPDIVVYGSNYDYPNVVYYECAEGYKLQAGNQPQYQKCLVNGMWGGLGSGVPVCEPVECYAPEEIRGSEMVSGEKSVYYYGDKILYRCLFGHEHSPAGGHLNRTCGSDKNWSGERPVCQRNSCGEPEDRDGTYKLGFSFLYEDTVVYTCNAGYEVSSGQSSTEIFCQANGTWTGEYPSCRRVSCGDPGINPHSSRTGNGFYFEDVLVYTCDPEYRSPNGIYRIECIEDRTWTYPAPECVEVDKANLTASVNASLGEPKDSEDALLIGRVVIIIMCVELGLVVLLDLTTIWKDIRVMVKNIKYGVRSMKRRVDSRKEDRVSPLPLDINAQ